MKRLRIAQILTSVHTGGAERVALLLVEELLRRGHEVTVVSLEELVDGPLASAFERTGARFLKIPKAQGQWDRSLFGKMYQFFRKEQFDVVHTHNPLPLMYAAPAARLAGSRVVHTKHGAHPEGFKRLMLRRAAILGTNAFVAVSQATLDYAFSIYEVFPWKTHVITNGTDLQRFKPDAEARRRVRAQYGIPDDAVVFGTVGRMATIKNHPLLVRSAAPLLGPNVRLMIVGGGQEFENTKQVVEAEKVADFVHLVGEQSDIPAYLAALDVFALSSDSEGMPLSLTEAMGVCLPMVSTRVGGVPKIITHEETGLLVEAQNQAELTAALRRLADSPELRRTMGERGRKVAEAQYSHARMVDDYERVYVP